MRRRRPCVPRRPHSPRPSGTFRKSARMRPKSGLVFDTLYREGEWVSPGVRLSTVAARKTSKCAPLCLRHSIGGISPGDTVQVTVDGVPEPFTGKVSYHFAQSRIYPAGHLQPREPQQTGVHDRGCLRSEDRAPSCIRASP